MNKNALIKLNKILYIKAFEEAIKQDATYNLVLLRMMNVQHLSPAEVTVCNMIAFGIDANVITEKEFKVSTKVLNNKIKELLNDKQTRVF